MTFDRRQWFFVGSSVGMMSADKERIKTRIEFLEYKQAQIKQEIKELKEELKGY